MQFPFAQQTSKLRAIEARRLRHNRDAQKSAGKVNFITAEAGGVRYEAGQVETRASILLDVIRHNDHVRRHSFPDSDAFAEERRSS